MVSFFSTLVGLSFMVFLLCSFEQQRTASKENHRAPLIRSQKTCCTGDSFPAGASRDFIAGYKAAVEFQNNGGLRNSEAARIERSLTPLNRRQGEDKKVIKLSEPSQPVNEKKLTERRLRKI
jgi:hypothetical protein